MFFNNPAEGRTATVVVRARMLLATLADLLVPVMGSDLVPNHIIQQQYVLVVRPVVSHEGLPYSGNYHLQMWHVVCTYVRQTNG